MNRALLDTDIFSEALKARDVRVTSKAGEYLAEHGKFTVSAVSAMEIVYGFHRKQWDARLAAFEVRLKTAEVLPVTEEIGVLAGRIHADLEMRGTPIGIPDVMIAAIAIVAGIPLVTGNVEHFEYVRAAGYGLQIENWRATATP